MYKYYGLKLSSTFWEWTPGEKKLHRVTLCHWASMCVPAKDEKVPRNGPNLCCSQFLNLPAT